MRPKEHVGISSRRLAPAALLLLATAATFAVGLARSGEIKIAPLNGDPARGETLYQGCMDCHAIDKNDVGPKHRGVVGRPAGIIASYDYSKALKNSRLTWDEPTLDRWLTDPSALVPGTKMFFNVPSAKDSADIIAYLAQQK